MKGLRISRFTVKICIIILFGIFVLYNSSSLLFFSRALKYSKEGRKKTATIAHQIVIVKYPFSIFSPISRLSLAILSEKGFVSESVFFSNVPPLVKHLPVMKTWSPYYVDGFALLCIVYYGICAIFFTFVREDRTRVATDGIKKIIFFIIYLSLFFLWAHGVNVKGEGSLNRDLHIAYTPIAIISLLWASWGFILVLFAIRLVKGSMFSTGIYIKPTLFVKNSHGKAVGYNFITYFSILLITFFISAKINNALMFQKKEVEVQHPVYKVSIGGLNLRGGPGVNYEIIDVLANGTKVELLRQYNNWVFIKSDAKEGWVYIKYLEEQQTELAPVTKN